MTTHTRSVLLAYEFSDYLEARIHSTRRLEETGFYAPETDFLPKVISQSTIVLWMASDSMKVLVAYTTRTGNTKRVAEAIYEEIEEEKAIREFGDVENLDDYDLVFVGFPIENFGPCEKAKEFLKSFCVGKTIVLFITHAAPEYMKFVPGWLVRCIEAASESNVGAVFNCQGELAENVRQSMLKNPDPMIRFWAEKSGMTTGQPDAARIERARLFVREIMKK